MTCLNLAERRQMRYLNPSSSALIPHRSGIAPSPRAQIDEGDCEQSTNPERHGIVYFANPNLGSMLWQFDAEGKEQGKPSVHNLFARLERQLTKTK